MRLVSMVTELAKGVGSAAGIRSGTEEPSYEVQEQPHGLEIRRYGPRIAAQTTVSGDEESGRNTGFRRLAGYIFGGNVGKSKIAMTSPVTQQAGGGASEKIAMTSPVSQESTAGGSWVIRFYMPAEWTMDTLPAPKDPAVELVEVPGETHAVLRFSGDRGPAAVAARTADLLSTLADTAWAPDGEPVSWFYDPPWTLSFRRRNEVAVPVAPVGLAST